MSKKDNIANYAKKKNPIGRWIILYLIFVVVTLLLKSYCTYGIVAVAFEVEEGHPKFCRL